jgi:hypothetical protein
MSETVNAVYAVESMTGVRVAKYLLRELVHDVSKTVFGSAPNWVSAVEPANARNFRKAPWISSISLWPGGANPSWLATSFTATLDAAWELESPSAEGSEACPVTVLIVRLPKKSLSDGGESVGCPEASLSVRSRNMSLSDMMTDAAD